MYKQASIHLKKISFKFDENKTLFEKLNLSFGPHKYGLVGRNGTGKSSLLKIISREIIPDCGIITVEGSIVYCPQQSGTNSQKKVASVLGISSLLNSLQRVEDGNGDQSDFDLIKDRWSFSRDFKEALCRYDLKHISEDTKANSLSGGEYTRLLLAHAFLMKPDILLLDEPSNNLDTQGRKALYQDIKDFKGLLLIASHDRKLLSLVDQILELSSLGIKIYGGNYEDFVSQKKAMVKASELNLQNKIEKLSHSKRIFQLRKERHEQGEAKGRRTKKEMIKAKGRTDKTALNVAKARSEKTNRKILLQGNRKLENVDKELREAKSRLEKKYKFEVELPKTRVPQGKVVIKIEDLNFSYKDKQALIKDFNLTIAGPKRVAIRGKNGSGKSTLFSLLLGKQKPVSGSIKIGVSKFAFLDQKTSELVSDMTVMENFTRFNEDLLQAERFNILAFFLFTKEILKQKVKTLSGGERIRLLLACILMSKIPPSLLVLDEPTNHLDLDSIKCIEEALKKFEGAILIASHDKKFLDAIGAKECIELAREKLS